MALNLSMFEELRKKWRPSGVLAVSVEKDRLRVGPVRDASHSSDTSGAFDLPVSAAQIASDPGRAGTELAAKLQGENIRGQRAVVTLPPEWALTAATDLPELGDDDLEGYLELQAEKEFSIPVSELALSHAPCELPDGTRLAALAAVPRRKIEAVHRFLEASGCHPVSINLGLGHLIEGEGPQLWILLRGGGALDLVVAAGGGIAALHSLPELVSGFDPVQFSRELRIFLGRPANAAWRDSLRSAALSGPADQVAEWEPVLRAPLEKAGLELRPDSTKGGAAAESARRFLRGDPALFEFYERPVGRWEALWQRFDRRRHGLAVAAAALLVVAPIMALLIRGQIQGRLESQWTRMEPVVLELEQLQDQIRTFRPWFDDAPRSVEILEALIQTFPAQGDIWATNIELRDGERVTCAGMARNQAAWAAFRERLQARPDTRNLQVQQVRGEDPIQFSVTYYFDSVP